MDLLRNIASILNMDDLEEKLREVSWHTKQQRFVRFNVFFDPDGNNYDAIFAGDVNRIVTNEIDSFQELIIRANLQLVRDLIVGFVQFEHIQPLLKRIDSSLAPIRKTLAIVSERHAFTLLTVISLRKANQEIKKILPLLIAKHFYNQHKEQVKTPPDKTLHLIIDEAHNILSQQSSREQETWKDYRLELFEEIIKEGRKFGIFFDLV